MVINYIVKETYHKCNGIIDYDSTFDNIICTKCKKRYFAKDLKKSIDNELIFVKGDVDMSKVYIYRGNNLVAVRGGNESDFIDRNYNNRVPSTRDQQLKEDFVIDKRNRKKMIDIEINIPNFERKVDTSKEDRINNGLEEERLQKQRSSFIPSMDDIDEGMMLVNKRIEKIKENKESIVGFNQEQKEDIKLEVKELVNNTINKNDIDIPYNLGEIISANSLDDEDEDDALKNFNISEKDFEENKEEESYIEEEETSNFEKITKKKQENTDSFY